MRRRILIVFLVVLGISILILTPIVAFTPWGANLLGGVAQISPAVSPSPIHTPTPTPTPIPTPVLTVEGKPATVTAQAVFLLDEDTGNILEDLNGENPMPMASTTKIMTALIAIQTADLKMVVTINREAYDEAALHDGTSAGLVIGDQITLKDLLYGLMLPSGDDAAIAIADAIGGSTDNFVNMMNLFAHHLQLYQTHFLNPDGLTAYETGGKVNPDHYTTARDLVRLADYAMKIRLFAEIVKTQEYTLAPAAHHHGYTWDNTNDLLRTYTGMTGVKTGWTPEAGGCLVFSATHAGHHLIGAILHSIDKPHRFSDAKAVLDWAFGLPLRPPAAE